MPDSEATTTDAAAGETWNPEDWTCIDCGEPSGPNSRETECNHDWRLDFAGHMVMWRCHHCRMAIEARIGHGPVFDA